MSLEFFKSPLIMPAIAICIGVVLVLFRNKRSIYTGSMLLGFSIILASEYSINQCVTHLALDIRPVGDTLFCNQIFPYIKGFGYLLVAIGLYPFLPKSMKDK